MRVDNLADELSDMEGHPLDILRGIAEDAVRAADSSKFFYLMDVWYFTERLLRIKRRDNWRRTVSCFKTRYSQFESLLTFYNYRGLSHDYCGAKETRDMATDWMTKDYRAGNDAVNILRNLAKDMKMIITMLDETREQGAWLRKKPVRSTEEEGAPIPCRDTNGMEPDFNRLKELEEENRQLKQMFADLSLKHEALKDFVEKKL